MSEQMNLFNLTSSLSRMSPSRGLDIDHWFRQSSNMMIFNTVDSIYNTNLFVLKPLQ